MSNNERNQNNQQKQIKSKSSVGSTLLIIFLIAVIMVSSSIGLYAWAKYTSSINGTATAQVAKWSFKLVDGVTETSDVIEFAFTRTDGYEHVAEGRLAPGTFGEFEIGIDARGTETILEYIIDVELENKPTYLKFYKDEDKTKEITVANNKFSVKGFMSLEDMEEIRTETIYWDWPYENGDDVTDTNDAGKLVTMQVSVTGYEVLEKSTTEDEETGIKLGTLNLGDYVDAGTMLLDDVTGVVMEKYEGNKQAEWRVAKKEGDTVTLILSDYLPNRHLSSISGIRLNSNGYTVGWPDLADAYEAVAHLTNSANWKSLLTGSKIEAGTIVGGLTYEDITDEFKSVTSMFTPHTASWNSSYGYWLASADDSINVRYVYHYGGVYLNNFGNGNQSGVRPAVTLKSDILLENVGENIYSIK